MEVLFPHCGAGDVHKKTVVATVSHLPATATKQKKITRTFGTFTEDLEALPSGLPNWPIPGFVRPLTLSKALTGLITDNQRELLGMQMDHIVYLDRRIALLDKEIRVQTSPFEEARSCLRPFLALRAMPLTLSWRK